MNEFDISKIDVLNISILSLARLLREHFGVGLSVSLAMARLIKEVHRLGVIRGKVVKL
jgi:hypothetical protein